MAVEQGVTLEQSRSQNEAREREIVGLGVVIIHPYTGAVWGIEERAAKAATGREVGQLSIPLETGKIGESPINTLHGAMAEAFSDHDTKGEDIRERLRKSLVHMPDNTFHAGISTTIRGRGIHCRYAVLLLDDREEPLHVEPWNASEVWKAGWRSPEEFFSPGVRPLAQMVMHDVITSGYYRTNINNYHQHPENRLPVLPLGFSIRDTYIRREQRADNR